MVGFLNMWASGRSCFVLNRFLVLLLVLFLVGSVLSLRVEVVEGRSRVFSFVQIGDTQFANKTQLQSVVDFIVSNKTVFGIEYVVHMGDIVEVHNNRTDWEIKNSVFSGLTNVVPFGWLAGNHDGEPQYYVGDDYFAFDVLNYPNMTASYDQGRSTAQYFDFGSVQVLFVNLDYYADKDALEWFESLYHQYDRAVVVFSTHSYLDFFGNYTKDTLSATYLDAYPRVNLVLCGHKVYAFNQQISGRQEIMFNYQRVPGIFPDLSDYIRLYSVYDDGSVDAITYSPLRNRFVTDSLNQFSFSLFTTPAQTPMPTPITSPTPAHSPTPTPTPTIIPTVTPTPAPSLVPSPSSSFPPESEPLLSQDSVLEFYIIVAAVFFLAAGLIVFMLKKR